jgi:hypothetical protein
VVVATGTTLAVEFAADPPPPEIIKPGVDLADFVMTLITPLTALVPHIAAPGPEDTDGPRAAGKTRYLYAWRKTKKFRQDGDSRALGAGGDAACCGAPAQRKGIPSRTKPQIRRNIIYCVYRTRGEK